MQWTFRSLVCLTLASIVLACAPVQQPPPGTMVPVTDVKLLSGKWVGTLIDGANMGAPAQVVISPDGTYNARFGDTSATGTVAPQPSGQIAFTMTSATGFLSLADSDSASTATLYDRGGTRVLVGSGRAGFYQNPFSWQVTEQK